MKVAFFTYPSAFQSIGGGEILMLKLASSLRQKGVDVQFLNPWNDRVESFDLLHVFSCQSECLGMIRAAVAAKVPVAVHPIAFETWASVWNGVLPKNRAKSLGRFLLKKIYPRFSSPRRDVLESATLLFPNSRKEAVYLERHFSVPAEKMFVVPNGVDAGIEGADPELFRAQTGIREPFVLCSGRIEPRKNQKRFIQAVNRLGLRAVVLGNAVKGYEAYEADCRRIAQKNVSFLPAYPSESGTLYSAYAASRVVTLPAYVETPGLVGLEAGLIGKPLSVTTGGPTDEYFGEHVDYLRPSSVTSIAESVQRAWERKPGEELRNRIKQNYLWEHVAAKVKEGYEKVSSKK